MTPGRHCIFLSFLFKRITILQKQRCRTNKIHIKQWQWRMAYSARGNPCTNGSSSLSARRRLGHDTTSMTQQSVSIGAMLLRLCDAAIGPIVGNMTSPTKPEVHNVLQRHRRMPWYSQRNTHRQSGQVRTCGC